MLKLAIRFTKPLNLPPMPSEIVSQLLDQVLIDATTSNTSCTPNQPFIQLGTGTPPAINYNLPQKTGFSVSGFLSLTKDLNDFRTEFQTAPENNLWQTLQTLLGANSPDLVPTIKTIFQQTSQGNHLLQYESGVGFFNNPAPTTGLNAARKAIRIDDPLEGEGGNGGGPDFTPDLTPPDKTVLNQVNYNTELIKFLLSQSRFPRIRKNFYGDLVLDFVPMPDPEPEIFLVLHYRVQSFLGNYGAGKVVKTMSLLPGEKTTISVKTFKEFTETQKYSDNVLDSFTQNSADSLEKMVETENSFSKVKSGGFSLGLKIPIKLATLDIGGNINNSKSSISKTINRSLSKHVEESQAQRKVEVNNETTTTETENEENSIVRELKNINLSRVLNFTFRQMNQEYTVVTYIDNASLMYSNGFPESEELVPLHDMNNFLQKYIEDDTRRTELKNTLIMSVYNLTDFTGTRKDLFKEHSVTSVVPSSLTGITPETQKFWGKDENYTQTITGTTFSVPGIITQIEKHILSTDSVITEALLGQAEALDCYNISLQKNAVIKTELDNTEKLQQITILNEFEINGDRVTDPALALKNIYGKCCEQENP